ncbi:hypothetical protein D3C85_1078870 [compost metagenome]
MACSGLQIRISNNEVLHIVIVADRLKLVKIGRTGIAIITKTKTPVFFNLVAEIT